MGLPAPRVLVLEDSVLVAMAIEAALVDRGFAVVVAGSLAAAHDRLATTPVTAALLDLQLPDGNSLDFASELAAGGCAVAICSGVDMAPVPDGSPAVRTFLKPVSAEALASWVASVLAAPEDEAADDAGTV
jgi:CheY-like chemotaxis protein